MTDEGLLMYGLLIEMPGNSAWVPTWVTVGDDRQPATYFRHHDAQHMADQLTAVHGAGGFTYRVVPMRPVGVVQGDPQ